MCPLNSDYTQVDLVCQNNRAASPRQRLLRWTTWIRQWIHLRITISRSGSLCFLIANASDEPGIAPPDQRHRVCEGAPSGQQSDDALFRDPTCRQNTQDRDKISRTRRRRGFYGRRPKTDTKNSAPSQSTRLYRTSQSVARAACWITERANALIVPILKGTVQLPIEEPHERRRPLRRRRHRSRRDDDWHGGRWR